MDATIVIIGAGHAGGELSVSLRQNGYAGRILVVTEETHLPYHRPPLSKAYLAGEVELGSLWLKPQAAYEKANVEFLLGARVKKIDRAAKSVVLEDGRIQPYDKLALATGGRARRLELPGVSLDAVPNVHYLRSVDDAQAIREHFAPGRRLVIIGGGYIGLEVASVAVKRGLHVTVLEAAPRVMARVTSHEVSTFFEDIHREAGVDLRLQAAATGVDLDPATGAARAVRCLEASGESALPADVVLVSIGLVPNSELAAAAGLAVDNGIVVDDRAQTSDPFIVAAGDCTNHPNSFYGYNVRLESVPHALEQARTAAATLSGQSKPYSSVPWFWSDQYGLKLQMVGLPLGHETVAVRGSRAARSFCVFYLQGRRVIAADVVGRAKEFAAAKRLVAERIEVDPTRLTDETVPLQTFFPAVAS